MRIKVGFLYAIKTGLLDRISGRINQIIDSHDYGVNQRNSIFDVRVYPTNKKAPGRIPGA